MKPEIRRRSARSVRQRVHQVHRDLGWWNEQEGGIDAFDLWDEPLNPLTSAHEDAQREMWQAIDALVDEAVQALAGRRSKRWWS